MSGEKEQILFAILEELNEQESLRLSPLATLSRNAVRRHPEERLGHRQSFAQDADRILHSRAFTRYIGRFGVV